MAPNPSNMYTAGKSNNNYNVSFHMTETIREKFIFGKKSSGPHWTDKLKDYARDWCRNNMSKIYSLDCHPKLGFRINPRQKSLDS